MDYSTILISELSKKAETYLMSAEYQESSIQRYRTIWRKLQFYCKKTGNNYYSYDICHSGIYSIYKITEGEKRTSHQTFCIKALRMLDEIYQQAVIKRCHQLPGVQVVECFSEILDMYLKYQESTEILQKTVQCKSIVNGNSKYRIFGSTSTENSAIKVQDKRQRKYREFGSKESPFSTLT